MLRHFDTNPCRLSQYAEEEEEARRSQGIEYPSEAEMPPTSPCERDVEGDEDGDDENVRLAVVTAPAIAITDRARRADANVESFRRWNAASSRG